MIFLPFSFLAIFQPHDSFLIIVENVYFSISRFSLSSHFASHRNLFSLVTDLHEWSPHTSLLTEIFVQTVSRSCDKKRCLEKKCLKIDATHDSNISFQDNRTKITSRIETQFFVGLLNLLISSFFYFIFLLPKDKIIEKVSILKICHETWDQIRRNFLS